MGATSHEARGLAHGAVGPARVIAFGASNVAPAGAVVGGLVIVVSYAGFASPLVILIAFAASLCCASSIAEFARRLPSAGSLYTYNSRGLGRVGGFLTGWMMIFAYGLYVPAGMALTSAYASQLLASALHVTIGGWVLFVVILGAVTGVVYLGISTSSSVDLVLVAGEVAVFAALAITILVTIGPAHYSMASLSPASSPNGQFTDITNALIYGITAFAGFEAAAALGEEARNTRRSIPASTMGVVIVTGLFYLLIVGAEVLGVGRHGIADLTGQSNPLGYLASRYWSPSATWAIELVIVLTGLGFVVAAFNAAIRVMFAMGRERALPASLARLSGRRTPVVAIGCVAVLTLVLGLPMAYVVGGARAFGYLAGAGGLSVVLIYLAVNIATIRAFRTEFRGEFRLCRHLLIPVAAAVLLMFPLWGILHPHVHTLVDMLPFLALGWLCLGVIAAGVLRIGGLPASRRWAASSCQPKDNQRAPEWSISMRQGRTSLKRRIARKQTGLRALLGLCWSPARPGGPGGPQDQQAPGQQLAELADVRIGGIDIAVQANATGQPATATRNWYARPTDEIAAALDVDPAVGLTAVRAAELLAANGPNALPEEKPKPGWRRFLEEYRAYMQIILVAAAVVSLLVKEWSTAVLLLLLTVLNAVVGLRQEGKAESAMNALKSMMKATARVRRDGSESEIPAEQVVVGDVVLIAAGDEVPADGRIIAASALQIDESALTGESTPAAKDAGTLPGEPGSELGPGDQTNMAFMNTPVTHGSGTVIITGTGAGTELGKISGMLSATAREESPLTRELDRLTLWIAAAAGLTMIVMFILGRQRGLAWDALFVSAVSLAIAAIPEALPTVTQTILSIGGVDLAKRNAIVKDLPSVETLGFTSAINSDKTGTLTMNQMTAVEVVNPTDRYTISGIGYGLDGKVHHAAGSTESIEDAILPYLLASDAQLTGGKVVGDPTEGALLVLGYKAGLDIDETRERLPRLATLPFDPTYKLMATFHSATDATGRAVVRCFVKGAAPAVMVRAATALSGGASIAWDSELSGRHRAHMERMEGEGRRVMAAATCDLDPAGFDPSGDLLGYVTELQLTSLVGMVDPPRDESRDAVASAQAAHIRVRMVTGDDVITGAAIAKQVGIGGEAILGADFAALPEAERLARIDAIGVVGRVAPEHKVLLAATLKKKGDVVAMTGDGVNDAPAIKAADIGIAMGSGTEVAKNAGRMILSDDNFATIVFAVEQGRKIYDNLTKYIRFVLILLVVFVLTFLGATLFNIAHGEPFTPAQVLWIHFVVNAPFGFALGFDRESPGLMGRRPRPRGESVLTTPVLVTVGLTGLAITIGLLSLIQFGTSHFHSAAVGNSMAFTAFALCLIVAAVECRSETGTVLTTATFDSKQMNWAMLGEFVFAVLVTQMDVFHRLLGTTDINLRQFGWALVPALALLVLWELGKLIARRYASSRSRSPASA